MSVNRLSSFFNRTNSVGTTGGSTVQNNGSVVAPQDVPSTPANASTALKELRDHIKKGLPVTYSTSALAAIVDAVHNTDSIDDRKLLLEQALSFVSKLEDGPIARTLRNKIIQLLYNDLTHPAATYVGSEYAFRTADGSKNNPDIPELGKAGTAYSRSVQQGHPKPKNQLPDAGLVFDTLLRRDEFRAHPGGLSALMFSFAPLVIHTVFRTSHTNVSINETSSYVDLGPLYGNNQTDQDKIRVRDGTGRLYPDTFCEDRLLLLPPAVCALLVVFSRNHNYIADKLLEINERGTWRHPSKYKKDDAEDKTLLLQQEEEIFQTARLVNCGWFGMVVFSDYFSTILGLVRYGSNWSLTPFDEMRNEDHTLFERGKGNSCSVEFNCLYRWHTVTSREDEQWTEEIFHHLFGQDKSFDAVTVQNFKDVAKVAAKQQGPNTTWEFGTLKRQPGGGFKDEDLAQVLQDATEHKAAAFGARGTPAVMRLNEVMGIEQSRAWGVCSLNEFRRFLGLKAYSSFLEWNPNPEIADAAEKLYGDIEHLELYVGLQAEDTKPLVEGAGLCPGYTVSRAILSDAIALTRGDRHFTHDFTPSNLTAWGFADCQRDPGAFGFGSTLGRLLLRTLPNDYTENSVYTFFPLMTPESMKTNLKKIGVLDQYDLSRPKSKNPAVSIDGHGTISAVLKDKEGFGAPYKARVERVIKGPGFFPAEGEKDQEAIASVLGTPELVEQIGKYFYDTTRSFIVSGSYTLVGDKQCGVDVVEVVKNAVVSWVATDLAGISLRTKESSGSYTAGELYAILESIYQFIFLDIEASKIMVLQSSIQKTLPKLLRLIKGGLAGVVGSGLSIAAIVDTVSSIFSKNKKVEYHDIVKRLYELGHSTDQLTNTILALMVTSTVELTLSITNAINLYIDTKEASGLAVLAKSGDKAKLSGYVYEALRVDPPFRGVFRVAKKDVTINGQAIQQGARVFLNLADANIDGNVFTEPRSVNISRGPKNILFGDGIFSHIGEGLSIKIVTETLRAIFSLDSLRRGPGQSGVLQRFRNNDRPELSYAYLNDIQLPAETPSSLVLLFSSSSQI